MASTRSPRQIASAYQRLLNPAGGEGTSSGAAATVGPGRPKTGRGRGRGKGRGQGRSTTEPPPPPALDQSEDLPPPPVLDQPEDSSPTLEDHVAVMGTTTYIPSGDKGTQQTEDNSAQSTPYLRGPTSLPPIPLRDGRPLVRPAGTRGWLVLSGALEPPRNPTTVLGCLCRKHFPGLVKLKDGTWEPAWSWDLYKLGSDDQQDNKQERVLADFWRYFQAEEGRETLADQTTHRACKKLVVDMIHEARLQAHVDYYRSIKKEPLNKADARKVSLTKEQYLQVPASWCMSHRSAWSRIVDRYLDPTYITKHEQGKRKRSLRTGPTHHQGSRNLPAFKRALELAHPDMSVSEFGAWATSHMGPVKSGVIFNLDAPTHAYSDPTVHAKVKDYAEAVRALRGSDHNLSTEPLETEVIVRLGQGRKHGRLWIADGADSSRSAPPLSDVRARSTAKSLTICARPTPTLSRVDELQAELEETKENLALLTAQLEATQKQMADMYRIIQSIGQASGVQVQLPALAPSPSAGSNNPATVSLVADRVNPSPQSAPPQYEGPQLQSSPLQ